MLPWREHPSAREEYLDAIAWYDLQEAGLGDRLATELDNAVDFVRDWSDAAPQHRGREGRPLIRRKRVEGFPYGLVYFVRDNVVIVIAYAHEKRRPGYWRRRLDDH